MPFVRSQLAAVVRKLHSYQNHLVMNLGEEKENKQWQYGRCNSICTEVSTSI